MPKEKKKLEKLSSGEQKHTKGGIPYEKPGLMGFDGEGEPCAPGMGDADEYCSYGGGNDQLCFSGRGAGGELGCMEGIGTDEPN